MSINKYLKYVILAGLFAITFIPLVVSKSLLFPFITGKAFWFRIIVEIIFACWLILALRYEEYRPKFSWISAAVIVFLVAIGIADLLSENPFKSFWSNFERMEGYIAILHFAAFYFVISSVFRTKEIWNKFFATSLFVSAIMAIYSFLQLAGKITINQGGVRVDGTFGNATYLGIYMVFHIFLAAYLFLNSKTRFHKVLLGIVALADLVILYHTATRGAILGLIGGGIITFLIMLIKSEKGDKIRKFAAISIFSILALVGVFLISKNNSYIRNNPVLGRFATLSFSELKTQGRFYVWPMAWKGFLERPILGWGQESFNFVFNKYYDPRMYTQEPWFDRTHDIVLDWLIAGGLVGLLSYISIFFSGLYLLWKKSILSRAEKSVFLGLMAAYVFHNLFVFDQIGSYILFFSTLAFIASNSNSTAPTWLSQLSKKLGNIFTRESLAPVWASLVVIITACGLYFWQYVPLKANGNLINILTTANSGQIVGVQTYKDTFANYTMAFPESLEHVSNVAIQSASNAQLDTASKQEIFNIMNGAFQTQLEKVPNDARYRLFYGLFLGNLGDYNGALTQLQQASTLSPNKQSIYFEIGSNLLTSGKTTEALAAVKKAYDLDPSYMEAKFTYGLVALAAGDSKLSEDLLADVDQNTILFDDRYLSILAQLKRWDDVINIAKERLARDPNNMQFHTTLAAAYLQAGQRQAAIGVIQDMIKINPSFKEQGDYYIKEIQAGRNP